MRNIHAMILAACATLGATAAYAQQATVAPSAQVAAPAPASAKPSDVEALSLMAKGDNWAGTNMLKAALAKDDTPLNRFNLATGYQRTGRIDEAQVLYQGLLKKGRTTNAVATTSGAAASQVFNLADESASRLLYIAWLKSERASQTAARASTQSPASADALGVGASATVGGPTRGEVSDVQASALDLLASKAP